MKLIKIAGVELPVHFGSYTLGSFCRERNITVSDLANLGTSLDLLGMYELALSGVRSGYTKQGGKCPYDLEQFCELLDNEPEGLNKVMEVFSDSVTQDDAVSGNAKRTGKK